MCSTERMVQASALGADVGLTDTQSVAARHYSRSGQTKSLGL